MAGNSFGRLLRLTTFGESHGPSIGGILDGVPAGIEISETDIQKELDLRKPGKGPTATSRKESDTVRIQSGVYNGKTTGTALAFTIENTNQHSSDYDALADVFRPGHADWTYWKKFNGNRDHRGGGRSSGRETAIRVAAGAIAGKILDEYGIKVNAATVSLGGIQVNAEELDLLHACSRSYFAASDTVIALWDNLVEETRKAHDTLGGIVQIEAMNVPAGLGDPVFDKISALLAHGLMSVGAVKGVEIGDGFAASASRGSINNDPILPGAKPGEALFASNHAGGILGGITSGQTIILRCAVKPIASISLPQKTIDIHGDVREIRIGGRHDLSAIPRIVPVLKAMTELVLCDSLLVQHTYTTHNVC
ncbi:MAG: chorismate synthase [Desulfovibrio sp.]|nr:chorismate synthase [Desulfovibrio sp.]